METRILTITSPDLHDEACHEAARALNDGSLVIFPTETVYGVGASARSADAMAALSRLKNRTPDKPFTLHLAEAREAEPFTGPLPPLAKRFITKTWPGPLTLVVPDRRPARGEPKGLVEEALYHEGTIGLRCPSHPAAQAILRMAGVPVAASSANLGGRPAPHRIEEALTDLRGKVEVAVDAGPTPYGRASTVVRIREDNTYEILREGAITARRLARLAHTRILFVCTGNLCRSPMAKGLTVQRLADHYGCRPEALEDYGIEIDSAGTGAVVGSPPSPNAIEVMAERGIDIRGRRSRPITVDALLAADYIWVMTRGHKEAVLKFAPEVAGRVDLVDPTGQEVPDPMGGDLERYRACARHLDRALADRLAETV